jgi:MtN3 and saliva related transmembrane protein
MDINTLVGALAAICTTISYAPQLKKCWDTGHTGDLSLGMFSILATGVALWVVYGFLITDYVVISANVVSFMLLLCILYFKVKDVWGRHSQHFA